MVVNVIDEWKINCSRAWLGRVILLVWAGNLPDTNTASHGPMKQA